MRLRVRRRDDAERPVQRAVERGVPVGGSELCRGPELAELPARQDVRGAGDARARAARDAGRRRAHVVRADALEDAANPRGGGGHAARRGAGTLPENLRGRRVRVMNTTSSSGARTVTRVTLYLRTMCVDRAKR